jgi:hypothetical protein
MLAPCRSAVFPRPWRFEPIPGGYRVTDANGLALAHVYGQPPDAIALSDKLLTDNEAVKLATYPERLSALVRYGSLARLAQAPDYPWRSQLGPRWENWRRLAQGVGRSLCHR